MNFMQLIALYNDPRAQEAIEAAGVSWDAAKDRIITSEEAHRIGHEILDVVETALPRTTANVKWVNFARMQVSAFANLIPEEGLHLTG